MYVHILEKRKEKMPDYNSCYYKWYSLESRFFDGKVEDLFEMRNRAFTHRNLSKFETKIFIFREKTLSWPFVTEFPILEMLYYI